MRDASDTEQVFVLGILMNRKAYPRFFARFASVEDGDRLIRERPIIDSKNVDYDWLRGLPERSLGFRYAKHLDDNGLDPDLFQPPPGLPASIAYVSQRMRQTHDIWHVLTGYSTQISGESALLAFTHAITSMPMTGFISRAAVVRNGVKLSWLRRNRDATRRGQAARFLPSVHWESRWEQPLEDVIREMQIPPRAI